MCRPNLLYYFDRKGRSAHSTIQDFYNAYTKKHVYKRSTLNNGKRTVIPLTYVSHKYLVPKKMNSSQRLAFVEWLFDVKIESESSGVTYSAFDVITDRHGRPYLYIDSLSKWRSNTVEDLLQFLDKKISEYHEGLSYEIVWRDELRETRRIFGR